MKTSNNKKSVAVAMSGGVDSSVTAALLKRSGYDVIGITLKMWDNEDARLDDKVCCTRVMARDAGKVCSILNIPHYTIDARDSFKQNVIERFEEDYLSGKTPNPCVHCNSRVKWGTLWDKAYSLGMNWLATGHYARIRHDLDENAHLHKGADENKDQSYFLWEIPKELLSVTMFPLGGINSKTEVRSIARELGFPVADKVESQEVCFVPEDNYWNWLKSRREDVARGAYAGNMINDKGEIIGEHDGFAQFTIGQRKGLGLGGGRKYYVTKIDPSTNSVYVGDESHLMSNLFRVMQVNWLNKIEYLENEELNVKIRYRDKGVRAKIKSNSSENLLIRTIDPVSAVTPGQSAVIYMEDEVLGGGIIERVEHG